MQRIDGVKVMAVREPDIIGVNYLCISVRSANALKAAGIVSVEQITALGEKIAWIPRIGKKACDEILTEAKALERAVYGYRP